ncbi:DNA mismatch repair endonuclease MutL [Lacticaseibacillus parakribbianus]|uniref:DNA mismatch repair endonuclease MutL n=1 Tax=Lacticaseibacillus parakribbianus TaxID=2970927 RepID=UPI0021CAE35D|nr:DNA mismatch repair endonuclease MutL [Lacticaseibacillus parakribbianus]
MPKIHELPETLANQIAAGEVIERPASIVKELVENSIDAGATQVDVLIEEAGLATVQVIDNGAGIEAADVPTAFLRHATSKILTTRDLFNVHSLGFRGEALASIAAIADVTLVTATDNGLGTTAHLRGGELLDQHTTAARRGTQLTVHDVFYNTPARLKYVKSQATELSRIADIVNRLALGHPEVAFSLKNGQNLMLKTAGHNDLQQTIAGIYGVSVAKRMMQVAAEDADFRIQGFTSMPDTTRASRNYLSLMINGRYIKNYRLTKALIAGYGSKLMVGRYPVAVIDVTMDPLLVDVNVHPTKQEVRLSKEDQLAALLEQAVRRQMGAQNLIPDALGNLPKHSSVNLEQLTMALNSASAGQLVGEPGRTAPRPGADSRSGTGFGSAAAPTDQAVRPGTAAPGATASGLPFADVAPRVTGPATAAAPATASAGPSATAASRPGSVNPQAPAAAPTPQAGDRFGLAITALSATPIFDDPQALAAWDARYASQPAAPVATEADAAPVALKPVTPPAKRFPDLRYLAQVHGTYLLAEAEDGLYLLDQHAAQERVNYEYYRVKIGEVAAAEQALLVPLVLDYPASDAVAIRAHRAVLEGVGVFLEDFGQNTFEVRQHPTWMQAGREEATIRELIDWVLKDGKVTVAQFREKAAIMISCKRAIKANHHLDAPQAKALIEKLAQVENPFNCPHGRPVLVHFSNTDLEKMFKRIQDSHESEHHRS